MDSISLSPFPSPRYPFPRSSPTIPPYGQNPFPRTPMEHQTTGLHICILSYLRKVRSCKEFSFVQTGVAQARTILRPLKHFAKVFHPWDEGTIVQDMASVQFPCPLSLWSLSRHHRQKLNCDGLFWFHSYHTHKKAEWHSWNPPNFLGKYSLVGFKHADFYFFFVKAMCYNLAVGMKLFPMT